MYITLNIFVLTWRVVSHEIRQIMVNYIWFGRNKNGRMTNQTSENKIYHYASRKLCPSLVQRFESGDFVWILLFF